MSNSFVVEIILATLIAGLAVFSWNPLNIFMPDAAAMVGACALLIVVAVFAALVWRERALDERDAAHQAAAGRVAFLAGTATLTLGVALQSFEHSVDPWLVGALVVMVLAKIGARMWQAMRN